MTKIEFIQRINESNEYSPAGHYYFPYGYKCPYCHSNEVEIIDSDWEGDKLWKRCTCKACDISFTIVYELEYKTHCDIEE